MHSEDRPRLLLIAYDFPPVVSAGIYRTAAMTRHLKRLGWDVTVLTVREQGDADIRQSSGLVDADTKTIRTRSFEYHRLRDRIKRRLRGDETAHAISEVESSTHETPAKRGVTRALKLPLRWIDGILTFPDKQVGWFIPLLWSAARLLRSYRFDIVITSSPPHSNHLPILILKRVFDFRWVADFRDPWTAPPRSLSRRNAPRIHRWLESKVLSRCDVVIANTRGNARELENAFAGVVDGKLVLMTNGFDPAFYPDSESETMSVEVDLDCDLVYTGHLYGPMFRKYHRTLKAMREMGMPVPKLHIFGPPLEPSVAAMIAAEGLEDHICYKGPLSHAETMSVAKRARALLLLVPDGPLFEFWVPSKLYTYLNAGAPVLALAPEGDAAQILEATRTGVVVRSSDCKILAKETVAFVEAAKRGSLAVHPDAREVQKYSWETLGARLDELLRGQLPAVGERAVPSSRQSVRS